MCKISVVMPVYNGANFIQKSIESVERQTFKDLELICVDDGSTDNSLEVLNDLAKEYDFLKVVTQQNQGAGAARNNGIRNAKGEYIAFLDADDEFYDADSLERMYNANTSDADMVSANLIMIENDGEVVGNFFYDMHDYMRFSKEEIIKPEEYGAPLSFYKSIFKRKLIIDNEIFFPDFRRGQDPPFLAKILTSIDRIQAVPVCLYGHHYRVAGGAEVKINTPEKKRGYIQHFKDTCDILAEGGLNDLSKFYKIHLFRYLTRDEVIDDAETFELFDEIWGLENDTFDESDFNYTRYIISARFYFIHKFDSEEFYLKTNKKFLQINVYDSFAISEEIMDKYFLVVYSYSLEDFKSNCEKYAMNNLKFKQELMEFKIKKFMINLDISQSETLFQNAKMVISNNPIWKGNGLSKNNIKKCYKVIKYDTMREFKESYN